MARGKATQVMIYPMPGIKDVIAKAAYSSGRRMSNFIIMSALEKIAEEKKCRVDELIPKSEYEELQRKRGRSIKNYRSKKP
jgi:hypothetical protein